MQERRANEAKDSFVEEGLLELRSRRVRGPRKGLHELAVRPAQVDRTEETDRAPTLARGVALNQLACPLPPPRGKG